MAEIKTYHALKRRCHLAGIAIGLLYWLLWVSLLDPTAAWIDGHFASRWVGLVATAVAMFGGSLLIHLPLDFYSSYVIEKQYDLTTQTPRSWLIFQIKSWAVGLVIGGILLGGLYALLWYAGTLWSLWTWLGFMVLSVVLAKVFPLIILPIFYPAKPLDRPTLAERLQELAGQARMTITGIFNLELSKETRKANAMLAGLGSSRRVYLSDTLLERFNDQQIAVVFAHELGHHMRGHIVKSIGLAAVVSSLLVALLHWRLNGQAGQSAAWPIAVAKLAEIGLLMSIFPLVIGPVTNAISRHFERQADSDALRLTDDPTSFRTAFELLTDMNMSDPDPPRWEEILFDDHPATSKRLAMAEHYAQKRPQQPQPLGSPA